MIDVKPAIVAKLEETNLPVYYELFIGTSVEIPAISYLEIGDNDLAVGDTLEYSNKTFQIKMWSKSISEIAANLAIIDSKLKEIGLRRTFATEQIADGVITKIMRYEGIAKNYR